MTAVSQLHDKLMHTYYQWHVHHAFMPFSALFNRTPKLVKLIIPACQSSMPSERMCDTVQQMAQQT